MKNRIEVRAGSYSGLNSKSGEVSGVPSNARFSMGIHANELEIAASDECAKRLLANAPYRPLHHAKGHPTSPFSPE